MYNLYNKNIYINNLYKYADNIFFYKNVRQKCVATIDNMKVTRSIVISSQQRESHV